MRRRILIAVLALGAIGGYAAGFAHMHHACHGGNWNGHHGYADHDCNDHDRDSR